MKILGIQFGPTEEDKKKIEAYDQAEQVSGEKWINPKAYYLFSETYDGEKEAGAIGSIKEYLIDHYALSSRSWQAYLDSDQAQLIIKKFVKWVIGSGLRLDADPNEKVLNSEGIQINEDEFSSLTENRFKVYANSKKASHSGEDTLNTLANKAFKASEVGGDVLVINRVEKGILTTELIDGRFIMSPFPDEIDEIEDRGNQIIYGVEVDGSGGHVAYWVQTEDLNFRRVKAFVKGVRMVYIIYGEKYRTNDARGIPLVNAVLDTVAKLDRYKEATVGSAEERQKIAYSIEHDLEGSGQNPLLDKVRPNVQRSITDKGQLEATRDLVYETTNKQVFNMPVGASLKLLDSKNEMYFESFMSVNLRLLCATVGIPFEVAFSWYDSNYSASRAALKDWEHTLEVERKKFSDQFYKRIYETWLTIEILLGKIPAPGYGKAIMEKNFMAVEAYRGSNFVGANIPHIDPVKEVQAERLKLGSQSIPLTTVQKATEAVNGGDYDANISQYKREVEQAGDVNQPKPEATPPKKDDEK